MVFQARIKWR